MTVTYSSNSFPRCVRSTPAIANSSGRYPRPATTLNRPSATIAAVASCSARRIGSWSGTRIAATLMRMRFVRAAIAAASVTGDDM
jgi:hypothetical protein